ncbi:replication endonuclease [Grimontia sp. NTOU-MAR1]|uniref:replication endonuclease n=1 Tax=Grimontia sp. NTOU-MAR1 TaxID=3111011 RepID=UPI002DB6D00F|nr:replication endonuclease [Grimontia sp. NTOU-MAR1]WRV96386.1 replication endonuclease [Grimontia sp. NTOU-MAR1]
MTRPAVQTTYVAAYVSNQGGLIRDSKTGRPRHLRLGNFANIEQATAKACSQMGCIRVRSKYGVSLVSRGEGKGKEAFSILREAAVRQETQEVVYLEEGTEAAYEAEKLAQLWSSGALPPREVSGLALPPVKHTLEPEVMSVTERKLYEVNPDDHDWRKPYFAGLPDYLVRYFANKYISIFNNEGRKAANEFVVKRMGGELQRRIRLVMNRYRKLPTLKKVAILAGDYAEKLKEADKHAAQVNLFTGPQKERLPFNFDTTKTKPQREKLLCELGREEIKVLAFKLANVCQEKMLAFVDALQSGTERPKVMKKAYRDIAQFAATLGIKPPISKKKPSTGDYESGLLKMTAEDWWEDRLNKSRKFMREHLAIAMGQVSNNASPYCSRDCQYEYEEQKKRNWEAIEATELFDAETEETVSLKDMVLKSVANPAIRRMELMVRTRGCEDIANHFGLTGLFLTLTAPSRYHNTYKKGGFIPHWSGSSPRDAQHYLNRTWAKIRAALARADIRWFGVRTAEPHHDGTPHWHLLLWTKPENVFRVTKVFIEYAIREDRHELFTQNRLFYPVQYAGVPMPQVEPNSRFTVPKMLDHRFTSKLKGVANLRPKVEVPRGVMPYPFTDTPELTDHNIDYSARCDVKFIDPEKGSATGYIAKYISKNIDGYAMEGEKDEETGEDVKDTAKAVTAWKARWNIRQFQFFGGAPVTTYRELRRYANANKMAFSNYLAQQERNDLINILEHSYPDDFIGPRLNATTVENMKMKTKDIFIRLMDAYQPIQESASVTGTLKAADQGDWKGYVMGQGGPFVSRDALKIRNDYEQTPFGTVYGETASKIIGFIAEGEHIKTRTRVWDIRKKSDETAEALALSGGSAASRSSVNNCTHSVFEGITKPFDIGDDALSALLKGSRVSVGGGSSIKIRQVSEMVLDDTGHYITIERPPQLIEIDDRCHQQDMKAFDNALSDFINYGKPEEIPPERLKNTQPDLSRIPPTYRDS